MVGSELEIQLGLVRNSHTTILEELAALGRPQPSLEQGVYTPDHLKEQLAQGVYAHKNPIIAFLWSLDAEQEKFNAKLFENPLARYQKHGDQEAQKDIQDIVKADLTTNKVLKHQLKETARKSHLLASFLAYERSGALLGSEQDTIAFTRAVLPLGNSRIRNSIRQTLGFGFTRHSDTYDFLHWAFTLDQSIDDYQNALASFQRNYQSASQ